MVSDNKSMKVSRFFYFPENSNLHSVNKLLVILFAWIFSSAVKVKTVVILKCHFSHLSSNFAFCFDKKASSMRHLIAEKSKIMQPDFWVQILAIVNQLSQHPTDHDDMSFPTCVLFTAENIASFISSLLICVLNDFLKKRDSYCT